MSELAAGTQSADINPVDDLEGFIAQRTNELVANAKPEVEAQPPAVAAEPAPDPAVEAASPTPEEKKTSWRDAVLDDVDDQFLKGKPASELLNSYKASVAAMQKAQREANEARSEVQRIRAEADARTVPPPTQAKPEEAAPPDDLDKMLFEDTPAALKLMESRTEERSRAIAREEYQKSTQETAEQHFKQAAATASIMATQRVAQLYGWDENEAVLRMKTAFPLINDFVPQYGPQLWTQENVYVGAIERLYGPPPTAQAAAEEPVAEPPARTPAAPAIPNPPGSGRPAPVAAAPTKGGSMLSRELQDARRVVAEQVRMQTGIEIDADDFARGNKRKGANA